MSPQKTVKIVLLIAAPALLLAAALVWLQHIPMDKRELAASLANPFKRQRAFEALLNEWTKEQGGVRLVEARVERVVQAGLPSGGTIYVVFLSMPSSAPNDPFIYLYLVREDGSYVEPWDLSDLGTRSTISVRDVNADGWCEIVGSVTERLPNGIYHDRLYVCRVSDPPVPIFQISFNRTGEWGEGRASWRLCRDEKSTGYHIELFRQDSVGRDHILVTFAWNPASETFVPIMDTGEIKWYLLPTDFTPRRAPLSSS